MKKNTFIEVYTKTTEEKTTEEKIMATQVLDVLEDYCQYIFDNLGQYVPEVDDDLWFVDEYERHSCQSHIKEVMFTNHTCITNNFFNNYSVEELFKSIDTNLYDLYVDKMFYGTFCTDIEIAEIVSAIKTKNKNRREEALKYFKAALKFWKETPEYICYKGLCYPEDKKYIQYFAEYTIEKINNKVVDSIIAHVSNDDYALSVYNESNKIKELYYEELSRGIHRYITNIIGEEEGQVGGITQIKD